MHDDYFEVLCYKYRKINDSFFLLRDYKMNIKLIRIIKYINILLLLLLLLFIATGTTLFVYNSNHDYNINNNFTTVSLNYDPYENISSYNWEGIDVSVDNGFIKGIEKEKNYDSLVIRSLSPLPTITVKNTTNTNQDITIYLENINPDFYSSKINLSFVSQLI